MKRLLPIAAALCLGVSAFAEEPDVSGAEEDEPAVKTGVGISSP